MSERLCVAMAQLDTRVGDVAGNTEQVIATALRARDHHGAHVVVFPELTLTGYPPEDLLFRPDFIHSIGEALARIRDEVSGVAVVVGFPHYEKQRLCNSAAVLQDGMVLGVYHKHHLPNGGVFDDKRYFQPGSTPLVVDIHGHACGITICEDLWHPGPARWAADEGAEVLFNLNASPYHQGKFEDRQAVIHARQQEAGLPVIYVNLVGGQDEVVYDGVSVAYGGDGTLAARAPAFTEGLWPVTLARGADGLVPEAGEIAELPEEEDLIYRALVRGLADYVNKNGFPGVVLGLSGGIDSAFSAVVAVDALGAERVHALMLTSRHTSQQSLDDAAECARLLGIGYDRLSVDGAYQACLDELAPAFGDRPMDTTEENMQSRARGLMLMAWSNKFGPMVLATGNKSEYAVGYATLYGDMCGGFAPLKDVYKTLVYRLAERRNARGRVVPQRVIDKAPTAELREDQKDEDSLPPYPVLDAILHRYVDEDVSVNTLIRDGYDAGAVRQAVALLHRNEYKRRQAAPGVKVTRKAFGRERRYPITSGYRPWL
ncbi:NAD+ synthase [Aquisalimonas lutea]|uniref:NAD+ synthase n=1 Tax=Aquisalimonas lutea TaxID=1327750 RepID=UPI0025B49DBE|nr:NAD+ synthase [Aquisalimonas lutea]MDN3515995.1 NAD+ synthase [Aquisalimonas lutea]